MSNAENGDRLLGVDVGGRRIGLAVSSGTGAVATALRTIDTKESSESGVDEIVRECRQRDIDVVVVGWPLRMDGTEGRAVRRVEDFVERLERALAEAFDEGTDRPSVRRWDERMTSSEVNTALRETGMNRKRRGGMVDKLAATRILQSFLDADDEKSASRQHGEFDS